MSETRKPAPSHTSRAGRGRVGNTHLGRGLAEEVYEAHQHPKIISLQAILATPDYFCGIDPIYAGLHSNESSNDGVRSRRVTAHVHLPKALWCSNPVVVLPHKDDQSQHVVWHELGHVLEIRLRARDYPLPSFNAVCAYAQTSYAEEFACAFHSWLLPDWFADQYMAGWGGYDQESREFFIRLSRSGW